MLVFYFVFCEKSIVWGTFWGTKINSLSFVLQVKEILLINRCTRYRFFQGNAPYIRLTHADLRRILCNDYKKWYEDRRAYGRK